MNISDFDYNLPPERIAIYPPKERGASRLMVLDRTMKKIIHDRYTNFFEYVNEGDIVIINNTKVEKSRIHCHNRTKNKDIEIVILERHALEAKERHSASIMFKGKVHQKDILTIGKYQVMVSEVRSDGIAVIISDVPIEEICETHGEIPIPPYLKRESQPIDQKRYQTIFAERKGSAAAPTASLNFTEPLKQKILERGAKIKYITLHVGLGTFLPVRSETIEDHIMHSEFFYIPSETITAVNQTKSAGNRIFAIGTTVTRTLEYCADTILKQDTASHGISGEADIFIYPGYSFKIVDALLTNFHAPRSTVLLMAATFAGSDFLHNAYHEALEHDYKFLSYGDSMLIL